MFVLKSRNQTDDRHQVKCSRGSTFQDSILITAFCDNAIHRLSQTPCLELGHKREHNNALKEKNGDSSKKSQRCSGLEFPLQTISSISHWNISSQQDQGAGMFICSKNYALLRASKHRCMSLTILPFSFISCPSPSVRKWQYQEAWQCLSCTRVCDKYEENLGARVRLR